MGIVRILHLSDLHARPERHPDMKIVLSALFAALDQALTTHSGSIDLICFTGDIAYSGRKEEYAYAADVFFDPLLRLLQLSTHALFVVPGNHDVDRSLINGDPEGTEQLLQTLTTPDEVNKLLDNTQMRATVTSRLASYADFVAEYLGGHVNGQDPSYYVVRTHGVRDLEIAVACLNTAWGSASDTDFGKLLLGERQIDCAVTSIADPALRIGLVHHPLEWLCDFDKKCCSRRLLAEFDLVLSGHLHDPEPSLVETPNGRSIFSSAGAVFDGRSFNGFSIIEIDCFLLKGQVLLWRYYDQRREFDVDLIVARDGKFSFDLVRSGIAGEATLRDLITKHALIKLPSAYRDQFMESVSKRARVVEVFHNVRGMTGAPWLLGLAIGLITKVPFVKKSGRSEWVDITLLAPQDPFVDQLFRRLLEVGRSLDDNDVHVQQIAESIKSLTLQASEHWALPDEQLMIQQLDNSVLAMIDPDSPQVEVLSAKILKVEQHLIDKEFGRAFDILKTLDCAEPTVRRLLSETLTGMSDFIGVSSLLSQFDLDSLAQSELENFIWSLCELGRLSQAGELLSRHKQRFASSTARIFREALRKKIYGLFKTQDK